MRSPRLKVARCAACGKIRPVQWHHVGGKSHLAWFMMPFCSEECHKRVHKMIQQAEINLEFTEDKVERIRRALKAIKIAEWMLLEQLKRDGKPEEIT